ncbi:MAG TPA: hypothetical protein VHN99_08730, partial [Deinococcales bacterium]|nr:hypothetical protein [Deinococcales bacterium]
MNDRQANVTHLPVARRVALEKVRGNVRHCLAHALPPEAVAIKVEVGAEWRESGGYTYPDYTIGDHYPIDAEGRRLNYVHPYTRRPLEADELDLDEELEQWVQDDDPYGSYDEDDLVDAMRDWMKEEWDARYEAFEADLARRSEERKATMMADLAAGQGDCKDEDEVDFDIEDWQDCE